MIWRHIASNFLTLLIVILIAAAAAAAWAKHQYGAPGPSAVAACVRVAPGASLSAVSEQLAEQGVVSNAYIFRAGADYAGKSRDLKFGSYLMPPHSSMEDVVGVITAAAASAAWSLGAVLASATSGACQSPLLPPVLRSSRTDSTTMPLSRPLHMS